MRFAKQCWTVLLTLALLLGVAAVAQQSSLVSVDISDVKAEIAKNISVDPSQVPASVQVPVDVAATVCGVEASALTSQAQQGSASCKAKSTNSALESEVQKQAKGSKKSQ